MSTIEAKKTVSKKLRAITSALMLFSMATPLVAHADPAPKPEVAFPMPPKPMPMCGAMGERGLSMALRALNLSNEQEDKVFAILHAQQPKLHENDKVLSNNMKELRELKTGKPFDQSKAENLTRGIGQAIASNMMIHIQGDQDIYQILTAEQRKKLDAMRKQIEQRQGAGTAPMPPMPPMPMVPPFSPSAE